MTLTSNGIKWDTRNLLDNIKREESKLRLSTFEFEKITTIHINETTLITWNPNDLYCSSIFYQDTEKTIPQKDNSCGLIRYGMFSRINFGVVLVLTRRV